MVRNKVRPKGLEEQKSAGFSSSSPWDYMVPNLWFSWPLYVFFPTNFHSSDWYPFVPQFQFAWGFAGVSIVSYILWHCSLAPYSQQSQSLGLLIAFLVSKNIMVNPTFWKTCACISQTSEAKERRRGHMGKGAIGKDNSNWTAKEERKEKVSKWQHKET